MKIVHTADLAITPSAHTRGGTGTHGANVLFDSSILGLDPKRPDNFYFAISHAKEGEFMAPQHRHTFAQIRYQLEGEMEYAEGHPSTVIRKDCFGYFPEGAYYGQLKRAVGSTVVLQFGDFSGHGYVERAEAKAAFVDLKSRNQGVFQDGIYFRNEGVEGPREQDANEVVFEHIRGRPMDYPIPQYINTIFVNTDAFPWDPVVGAEGVEERDFGTFGSTKVRAVRYKLEPGASLVVFGRGVCLVKSGSGTVAEEAFAKWTGVYLDEGENTAFTASEASDILFFGLPSRLRMGRYVSELDRPDLAQ